MHSRLAVVRDERMATLHVQLRHPRMQNIDDSSLGMR